MGKAHCIPFAKPGYCLLFLLGFNSVLYPHTHTESAMGRRPVIVASCFFLLVSAGALPRSAASPATTVSSKICPLDVKELGSYPWMIRRCSAVNSGSTNHCCEAIMDLIKILLFSWLHTTGSFLLPSESTGAACLEEVYGFLRARGIEDREIMACKIRPREFVTSPASCNRIENVESFKSAVDTQGMVKYCNGSRSGVFECNKCIQVMALALNQLKKEEPGTGKSSCALFVMMYVGGAVNSYSDLGPDAAYCLMGAINLPVLAPTAALWPDSTSGQKQLGNYSRKRRTAIKIGLAVGVPVVITIALLLIVYACLEWSKVYRLGMQRIKIWRKHQLLRESVDAGTGLFFFGLDEMKAATANFSASNVIGEGGFSTIYRGALADGSQIAVKRFKDFSTKGDADFRHEVQVISSVRHRNLLPLKGYCIGSNYDEGIHEQLLVYDFMANGSLADYLFRSKRSLSWAERQNIAVGIARGLAYLHEDAKPAIIHRDVKTANILLDADLNPLVADFGLAKFKPDDYNDKTHYTTRAVGTLGYVAPEYALYGHLTDKSDVFSFGIVLLEIMSGRRALGSVSGNVDHILISEWACDLMQKGLSEEVIDKRIRELGPKKSMERVILLGLQCAHPRVACRPSISQAQAILESLDRPLPEIITTTTDKSESSNNKTNSSNTRHAGEGGQDLKWLVSPDIEGRISYGSATLGNISMDSYWNGR